MFKLNSIIILIILSIIFVSCNTISEDDKFNNVITVKGGERLSKTLDWETSDTECTVNNESYLEITPGHTAGWVDFDINRNDETINLSGSAPEPGTYQINYINYYYDRMGECKERTDEVKIEVTVVED